MQSDAIRCNPMLSAAVRCYLMLSDARMLSDAIRSNPMQSDAIRCYPMLSHAIRCYPMRHPTGFTPAFHTLSTGFPLAFQHRSTFFKSLPLAFQWLSSIFPLAVHVQSMGQRTTKSNQHDTKRAPKTILNRANGPGGGSWRPKGRKGRKSRPEGDKKAQKELIWETPGLPFGTLFLKKRSLEAASKFDLIFHDSVRFRARR